jgi:hypothetical protein
LGCLIFTRICDYYWVLSYYYSCQEKKNTLPEMVCLGLYSEFSQDQFLYSLNSGNFHYTTEMCFNARSVFQQRSKHFITYALQWNVVMKFFVAAGFYA